MYALCVAGAVNTQVFVWKFFYALYIYIFIHSFIHTHTHTPKLSSFLSRTHAANSNASASRLTITAYQRSDVAHPTLPLNHSHSAARKGTAGC